MLSIQNISKAFGAVNILTDFSLDVPAGTRLCVCGPNGCGKTTLLKILAAVEKPDSGKVSHPRTARVGYVQQELSAEDLSSNLLDFVQAVLPDWNDFWHTWEKAAQAGDERQLEVLALKQAELEQLHGYNPEHRARAILFGLGFSERRLKRTMQQLSGGWRERAKLARVLTAGADILLLDEPTNHLDLDAVEWLENFLLSYEGVLVFVAHDLVFMDNVGTHILYLGSSRPVYRRGTFSQFVSMQEEFEEQREREAKKLEEEIGRKMDFVRRFRAKPNKARQAASRQKMAKKLERELENYRPETKRRELEFRWPEPEPCENVVLNAKELGFTFSDGKIQFTGLDFSIYNGQRVALVGHNGCGKTTLLKVITRNLENTSGELSLGPSVKLGYFSQHQSEVFNPESTTLAEIRRLSDPRSTEEELMSVLGLFMLGQNYFDRAVGTLSGGEKSRLALATLFLARCNFLVLDEPTNHLDLESREALIEALGSYEGTVLMVAHDRHLLSNVADEIWEMTPDSLRVYSGGYEEYSRARREEKDGGAKPAQDFSRGDKSAQGVSETLGVPGTSGGTSGGASGGTSGGTSGAGQMGLSREEIKVRRREQAEQRNKLYREFKPALDSHEKKHERLKVVLEEQSRVEKELALPEVYSDSAKMTELLASFTRLDEEALLLMHKMEELEAALAEFERRKKELED